MSGTVTDKRISREVKKADGELCKIYEDAFPTPAPEEFWKTIDAAEDVLAQRLKPRPLGVSDIRHALSAYTSAFRRAADAGTTTKASGSAAG